MEVTHSVTAASDVVVADIGTLGNVHARYIGCQDSCASTARFRAVKSVGAFLVVFASLSSCLGEHLDANIGRRTGSGNTTFVVRRVVASSSHSDGVFASVSRVTVESRSTIERVGSVDAGFAGSLRSAFARDTAKRSGDEISAIAVLAAGVSRHSGGVHLTFVVDARVRVSVKRSRRITTFIRHVASGSNSFDCNTFTSTAAISIVIAIGGNSWSSVRGTARASWVECKTLCVCSIA